MESDIIVSCPYNKAHRITKSKYMQHVTKCKAHAYTDNMIECPLNKSHIIHASKLKDHIESCQQLGDLVVDTDPLQKEQQLPTYVGNIESEENWDDDPEVPNYNAFEVAEKKNIIRFKPGLSKAQRRAFRESERKRLMQLQESETSETHKPSTSKPKVVGPSVCPPRFGSALKAEKRKTASQMSTASLSEDIIFPPSVCDNSTQSLESSFKDPESLYSPKTYNELISKHNIENTDDTHQNHMTSKRFTFQEPQAGNSVSTNTEDNLPTFDQNQELPIAQVDEPEKILEAFRNEGSVASTSSTYVSNESLRKNKLLYLLKNPECLKEIHQSFKNETATDHEETVEENTDGSCISSDKIDWEEFNQRLTYLTDIQKAAAKESTQLLMQLHNLKLRQDTKK